MTNTREQITKNHIAIAQKQSSLRGQILGAYAQAEFLLLHTALQCRTFQEYWKLNLQYHRKLASRITQANQLFNTPGPLKKYNDRITPLLKSLEPFKDDRDFFAHAFCQIRVRDETPFFTYKMIRKDGDRTHINERTFSLSELEALEEKITALAQNYVTLFKEIYLNEGLEKFGSFTETLA